MPIHELNEKLYNFLFKSRDTHNNTDRFVRKIGGVCGDGAQNRVFTASWNATFIIRRCLSQTCKLGRSPLFCRFYLRVYDVKNLIYEIKSN
jgi:hypothetical protein